MGSEWERKAKKKLLKQGINACSTYVNRLPLAGNVKDELLRDCILNWLEMTPEEQRKIQRACDSGTSGSEESQACVGEKITRISEPLGTQDAPAPDSDICEKGAKYAPDEETALAFEEWCYSQVPRPLTPTETRVFKRVFDEMIVKHIRYFSSSNRNKKSTAAKKISKSEELKSGSMSQKIQCNIKESHYLLEEEIRCELINHIFENYKEFMVWNCRYDNCPSAYMIGGVPFKPYAGDILLRKNSVNSSVELKFDRQRNRPVRVPKYKGKHNRELDSIRLDLTQLKILKMGRLIFVIVAEFITKKDKKLRGIGKGYRSEKEIDAEIRTIQKYLGNGRLDYSYLIISPQNYKRYEKYIEGLRTISESRRGRVVRASKKASFSRLYLEFTPPEERFHATRANLVQEIARKISETF